MNRNYFDDNDDADDDVQFFYKDTARIVMRAPHVRNVYIEQTLYIYFKRNG